MTRIKHNWFKRLIALLLTTASLLQWLPAGAIATADDTAAAEPTYKLGDVNGDSHINALDVNLMRRHIVGGYDVAIDALAADVNCDGTVNSRDAHNLRRYIADGYGIELKTEEKTFTVQFETGNGTAMAAAVVKDGTPYQHIPNPLLGGAYLPWLVL